MAELADAQASGACELMLLEVRLLSSALNDKPRTFLMSFVNVNVVSIKAYVIKLKVRKH